MKRIIIIAIVSCTAFLNTKGQVWNTVGAGLPPDSARMDVEVYNDELYVMEVTFSTNWQTVLRLKKWNGITWTTYPSFQPGSVDVGDMEFFNGDLYVGLVRYSFNQDATLLKFDGSAWSEVAFSKDASARSVRDLEVYNGELYIAGQINMNIGGNPMTNLIKYDGNSYTDMPEKGWIYNLHVHNGDLYARSDSVYRWDGNQFKRAVYSTRLNELTSYNGDLYGMSGSGEFYDLSSDTAQLLTTVTFKTTDMDVFNNELYIVGDSLIGNWGPSAGGMVKYDGQSFTTVLAPPSLREGAAYQGELYYFSPLTVQHNGVTYNRAFRTDGNFSLITGTVYHDQNQDCFFNTSESAMKNGILSVGGYTLGTTANGDYSLAVPPGTYSLDTFYLATSLGKNYTINCTLPTQIVLGTNQNMVQDIPISNMVPVDGQVFLTSFTGWRARHGFTEAYRLDFNNTGNTTVASANVELQIPATFNMVSSSPSAASTNGNLLTYNFLNVQPGETRSVTLWLQVDMAQNNIGDTIGFTAAIKGLNGDADLGDNADTLVQWISAAVDPNDKQASASEIEPGTEKVDYHIRFQNTGTDTAVKVTVIDTLDMSLPVTKIIINSASHPYSLSIKDNILVWEFDNIMLPDSASNPIGSQGFVRFTAGLNPSLGVGDTIDNDAEIYFDYQPPVHTNHAKTAIVSKMSLPEAEQKPLQLHVFPNPASDEIHLLNDAANSITLSLIDHTGKLMDEIEVESREELVYPIGDLPRGVYFLQSENRAFRVIIR